MKRKILSKSQAAKKARSGADMGKPGKGFSKGVSALVASGHSASSARKIMGAQFQRMRKAGKL
jgi:hypothetical protein